MIVRASRANLVHVRADSNQPYYPSRGPWCDSTEHPYAGGAEMHAIGLSGIIKHFERNLNVEQARERDTFTFKHLLGF